MMKLFLLICEYLLIKSAFGGCFTGTTDSDDRRLGIETNNDVSWAGADAKIFANVYADGSWDGWRRLDNSNCDDFVVGAVDYFDDFEDITDEWEGIAFYICDNDGLLIETLYYWDGHNEKTMNGWEPGVFGPFPDNCLYSDATNADSQDEPNSWYSDIWIDGDTEGCDGVVFQTDGSVGRVWTETLPGRPDCDASEYGAAVPVFRHNHGGYPSRGSPVTTTSSIFEQQLMNYLMIVIGIALLLFVSNSCLITAIVRNNYANKAYQYGKVYKTDME